MNMRVVGIGHLTGFYAKHRDAEKAFRAWLHEVKAAGWKTPLDVMDQFPRASTLSDCEVVFRIRSRYRIVAEVSYEFGVVIITHAFTHPEYERWFKRRLKQ